MVRVVGGGTHRIKDPDRCSALPSSPVSNEKCRQKTESLFAKLQITSATKSANRDLRCTAEILRAISPSPTNHPMAPRCREWALSTTSIATICSFDYLAGAGVCCCAGATVIGAGAAVVAATGLGRTRLAAGFAAGFAADVAEGFFLLFGFLTSFGGGGGGAGVSSATTGFGLNCVGKPVAEIGSMFSVSGRWPLSVKVTDSGALIVNKRPRVTPPLPGESTA